MISSPIPAEYLDILKTRLNYIDRIIEEKTIAKATAPEGRLRLSNNHNSVSYYHKTRSSNNKSGTYICKTNMELISALAQKEYDSKILETAKTEYRYLNQLLTMYEKACIETIYETTNPNRRSLINPVRIPDNEYIKQWISVPYNMKPINEDSPSFITHNKEQVRSKSELHIANTLNMMSIPYRYEYPLSLCDGITIHPDFTLLNVRLRKEYIWEHFGMMDDINYISNALNKLTMYHLNGYYIGKNLLITYETLQKPINTSIVENIIREFLL